MQEPDHSQVISEPEIINTTENSAAPQDEGRGNNINTNYLGTAPILKLIAKFSIPAIIGMLINSLYNLVDRIFVGNSWMGKEGIAALQYAWPPILIAFGLAVMIGVGGSVLYSIHKGKKEDEYAGRVMNTAFTVSVVLFAVLTVILIIFIEPITRLFVPAGVDQAVFDMTRQYLKIIIFGLVFQGINVFGNNFVRATGNPLTSTLSMALGGVANIILDYIFIFPLDMGIEGAAIATVIAQGISTVWMLYFFFGAKGNRVIKISPFRLRLTKLRIDPRITLKIASTGFSAFVLQAAGSLLIIVINSTLTKYALAEGLNVALVTGSMGTIYSVQTIFAMPLTGLNHGLVPIMGYNYGACEGRRVKQALFSGIVIGTVIGAVGWLTARIFPAQIIGMFTSDTEFAAIGTDIMNKWFLSLILLGVVVNGGNYFQAVGKAPLAIGVSLLRQIILPIPFVLLLPHLHGLSAVYYAQPLTDIIAFTLVMILLVIEFRRNPLYRRDASAAEK